MAAIHDLIAQITDERLRKAIEEEVRHLTHKEDFGLVFNRHVPENLLVPDLPIEVGEKVAIKGKSTEKVFTVVGFDGESANLKISQEDTKKLQKKKQDLVVVRHQEAPVYPYLKHVGRIQHKKSVLNQRPSHALIKAENFHALKLLQCFGENSIDCIYIDPPYNKGAKDWRYNNSFVDKNDGYRHSKWLAMMERRLIIARKLLKINGVLFVAIDETENAALTMLIRDRIFKGYQVYNIAVKCYSGAFSGPQKKGFTTNHESLVTCFPSIDNILTLPNPKFGKDDTRDLYADGTNSLREDSPTKFYPIWVDPKSLAVVDIGEPFNSLEKKPFFCARNSDGAVPIWPITPDGEERRWRVNNRSMKVRVNNKSAYFIHSNKAHHNGISGEINYVGKERTKIKSIWIDSSFDNGIHGKRIFKELIGRGERFDFPKSPYSVFRAVESVCHNRPEAKVLDFFAGSGTTLEAVCLLNSMDNGNRQCILISNNENCIFDKVTTARAHTVITGERNDKTIPKGEWKIKDILSKPFSEGFCEQSANVFSLQFSSDIGVAINRNPERLLNLLWLRLGSHGNPPNIDRFLSRGYYIDDHFNAIFNARKIGQFLDLLKVNLPIYYLGCDSQFLSSLQEKINPRQLLDARTAYYNQFTK